MRSIIKSLHKWAFWLAGNFLLTLCSHKSPSSWELFTKFTMLRASPFVFGFAYASKNDKWPMSRCRFRPKKICHSSCIVFNTNVWIFSKMLGKFLKLWTSTGYFTNSFRFIFYGYFCEVSNPDHIFLKLVWFICN